jgi:hypothetical protein
MIPEIEEATFRAFVVPRLRTRYLESVRSVRLRRKLLERLYHWSDFDPRYAIDISPGEQDAEHIYALLQKRRAPGTCYVISASSDLDGAEADLADALVAIVGLAPGTIISCVRGRLAYFEGEDLGARLLLHRPE